jgi:hypothetical protein
LIHQAISGYERDRRPGFRAGDEEQSSGFAMLPAKRLSVAETTAFLNTLPEMVL